MITQNDIKKLLDTKFEEFNTLDFIKNDPIQIPKLFTKKEDIEISGFLTSTIAWGQRKTIIKNAKKLITLMDNAPYDFIINHKQKDLSRFNNFKHRTFNSDDCIFFMSSLQNIYKNHRGLENAFFIDNDKNIINSITKFRNIFFETPHLKRTQKHISNTEKNSAAKRINMFLRWMIRNDNKNVDFGIWKHFSPSQLLIPLDVHTSNVSRKLGLLTRKQNDLKSVIELTNNLKKFDKNDPVKYDFALFGLGVTKQM